MNHRIRWQKLKVLESGSTNHLLRAHTEKNQTTNDEVELDEMDFLVPGACWQDSGQVIADSSSRTCALFAHVEVWIRERKYGSD